MEENKNEMFGYNIEKQYVKCVGCGQDIECGLFYEMLHYTQCFGEEKYAKMLELGKLCQLKMITVEQFKQGLEEIIHPKT